MVTLLNFPFDWQGNHNNQTSYHPHQVILAQDGTSEIMTSAIRIYTLKSTIRRYSLVNLGPLNVHVH